MIKINRKMKAIITKPRYVKFWGKKCLSRPVFIESCLGDGGKLLAITPLNDRPNYYVIRVDSTWSVHNYEDPCVADHIDEIYEMIEEQTGPREWQDDHGRRRVEKWPAPNLDCGSSWWDYDLTRQDRG